MLRGPQKRLTTKSPGAVARRSAPTTCTQTLAGRFCSGAATDSAIHAPGSASVEEGGSSGLTAPFYTPIIVNATTSDDPPLRPCLAEGRGATLMQRRT